MLFRRVRVEWELRRGEDAALQEAKSRVTTLHCHLATRGQSGRQGCRLGGLSLSVLWKHRYGNLYVGKGPGHKDEVTLS